MTLDYVIPTQPSVIQTIHCNVGLKCLFLILPKCLFVIFIMYAYFIDISQGSVETHLRCGGIYNNHIIANSLQSVPVKKFWKLVNNWWKYGQKQNGTFFWPTLYNVANSLLITYNVTVYYCMLYLWNSSAYDWQIIMKMSAFETQHHSRHLQWHLQW